MDSFAVFFEFSHFFDRKLPEYACFAEIVLGATVVEIVLEVDN